MADLNQLRDAIAAEKQQFQDYKNGAEATIAQKDGVLLNSKHKWLTPQSLTTLSQKPELSFPKTFLILAPASKHPEALSLEFGSGFFIWWFGYCCYLSASKMQQIWQIQFT